MKTQYEVLIEDPWEGCRQTKQTDRSAFVLD
jgi:hypothetical protein